MVDENTQKEEIAVEAPIEPFNNESQDILVVPEPESVSTEIPESPTAQIPVNEPIAIPAETPNEPKAKPVVETVTIETKPIETTPEELPPSAPLPEEKSLTLSEPVKEEVKIEIPEPIQTESKPVEQIVEPKQETKSEPEQQKVIPVIIPTKNLARELLIKARNVIQSRKRKKLDKIMTLFLKKQKITNDEVEKFMHISDATTGRYLSILVKEGKIKQSGKTGKSVFYSKI